MNQLCEMTNPYREIPVVCEKQHRDAFCRTRGWGAVWSPVVVRESLYWPEQPMSYDRLREYRLNVSNHQDPHLPGHCRDRVPLFEACFVRARHKEQNVREITEAELIISAGSYSVSMPSLKRPEGLVGILTWCNKKAQVRKTIHSEWYVYDR